MNENKVMLTLHLLWIVTAFSTREGYCQRDLCSFLSDQSSLNYPGLSQEPTSSIELTVDEESTTTFSCSGIWVRSQRMSIRSRISRISRFCDLVFNQNLQFESMEDIKISLSLIMEWEIDGMRVFNLTDHPALSSRGIEISTNCTIDAEQLYDIVMDSDELSCSDRITNDLIPRCTSAMSIRRVLANNNVQLRCLIRPQHCIDGEFADLSNSVNLRLQGVLSSPPGLRVDELNSTTLYLSWNRPSTLAGIPILYYSVSIDNLVSVSTVNVTTANQPSINPNMTSLDLSAVGSIGYLHNPGCESLKFSVRAWNSVGEGSSSFVVYSQESLQSIKTYTPLNSPDTICMLCVFALTSEARGCQASLQQEMSLSNHTTNTTIRTVDIMKAQGTTEVFDCFSRLYSGNYTVNLREIECTGGIGLNVFNRGRTSLPNGLVRPSESTESSSTAATNTSAQETSNASIIGLSVFVVVLIVAVLFLVLVILMMIRKANKNGQKPQTEDLTPTESSKPTIDQHTPHPDLGREPVVELIYENDYDFQPVADTNPLPSSEYSYTTVDLSSSRPKATHVAGEGTDGGIEMKSCMAYGKIAQTQ